MNKKFDPKYKKNVIVINPGEYYATNRDEIISTILGSCISVCLYEEKKRIAGMNHFMLVGDFRDNALSVNRNTRYAIYAMERLIEKLIKLGAHQSDLKAKIFGGGHVLNVKQVKDNVPTSNINFANSYLKMCRIPIKSSDTAGNYGRKIFFFTNDFTVYVKKLQPSTSTNMKQEIKLEEQFYKQLKQETS